LSGPDPLAVVASLLAGYWPGLVAVRRFNEDSAEPIEIVSRTRQHASLSLIAGGGTGSGPRVIVARLTLVSRRGTRDTRVATAFLTRVCQKTFRLSPSLPSFSVPEFSPRCLLYVFTCIYFDLLLIQFSIYKSYVTYSMLIAVVTNSSETLREKSLRQARGQNRRPNTSGLEQSTPKSESRASDGRSHACGGVERKAGASASRYAGGECPWRFIGEPADGDGQQGLFPNESADRQGSGMSGGSCEANILGFGDDCVRVSRTQGSVLACSFPARGLGGTRVLIVRILWTTLVFLLSAYLLVESIHEQGATADLCVLIGAMLFAGGLVTSVFIFKRYLFMRRLERHVRGRGNQ